MNLMVQQVLSLRHLATVVCLACMSGSIGQATAAGLEMAVHEADGALSLSVDNAPLSVVLEAIGAEAGITVTISGDLGDVVSDQFFGVPLDEAIRRVLNNHNFIMLYEVPEAKPATRRLREVHVYARTTSQAGPSSSTSTIGEPSHCRAPGCTEVPENAETLHQAAGTSVEDKAEARRRAVALLARKGGDEARAMLEHALQDEEEHIAVRLQAIRGLYRIDKENAVGALSAAVMDDQDAEVRLTAAQILAHIRSPESILALEEAADDPNPKVRNTALLSLSAMQNAVDGR